MTKIEYIDLTDFFSTKSQAIDFAARISLIAENIYETSFDLENDLQKQFGLRKKDKFLALLRKNNIPLNSNSDLNIFFEKIQKLISELPTVDIVLAIEPNNEVLNTISNWFLINLKKQVLINVKIDPKIIAGASIGYQGKQVDASIDSLFKNVSANVLGNNDQEVKAEAN
jgi:F0F1-type ATP synthase delta subunit